MKLDPTDLYKIANMEMPFGKYKGRILLDLPEAYISWFSREGWPAGELGRLLAQLYDIKINGLSHLIAPLRNKLPPSPSA